MFTHDAVTRLSTGIVVDKSKIADLDAVAMSAFFAQTYGLGLPVTIVDSAGAFFLPRNLIALLEAGDPAWELVSEKLEVSLVESDLKVIQRAIEIRKEVLASLKTTYPFAEVPAGWSIDRIVTNGNSVRRITERGTYDEYTMGLKTLKRIWDHMSFIWFDNTHGNSRYMSVNAGGYNRDAVLQDTYIQVGCQRIQRYEIEQFALSQGWAIPS